MDESEARAIYAHGACEAPLLGMTVGAAFDGTARRRADGLALAVPYQNIHWSYGELKQRVDGVAAGLVGLGLESGERVGIVAPNCAEWVVAQFATAKAGLVLVNVNPAYRLPELNYALNAAGCSALITAPNFKTSDYIGMLNTLMPKYWNDPERTGMAIDETRWIASGDIAVMDEAGYFQIVGRIKDMLIRGGENIFPREIEEFLYSHPGIEEAEVFGVPDPKYGEEVCAWIKLKPGASATAEEIRGFCEGRIAHFKVPRYIKFVDDFPMTVTGKVQKYVMREAMAEELGAAAAKRR